MLASALIHNDAGRIFSFYSTAAETGSGGFTIHAIWKDRKGDLAYPVMALAILLASATMRAQDASSQQQQTNSQSQSDAQTQTQAPAQRTEVLREAQARVKARRRLRVQQIIQGHLLSQVRDLFWRRLSPLPSRLDTAEKQ